MMKIFFSMGLVSVLLVLAFGGFFSCLISNLSVILDFELMSMINLNFSFILLLDFYSMSFLFTVMLISFSVFIFSTSYMSGDKYYKRFHYLLLSFVLSMVLLILSPNLVSILLGWDGLGISSYLLVIYYSSGKAFNAGMITLLSNRVGDALIIISFCYLISLSSVNLFMLFYGVSSSYWVVGLVILAAGTKSAQIPFSSWLPAAMAAPTPVSSLVHSSTLVTAGVYLVFRLDSLLAYIKINSLLLILGSLTMFMASLSAFFEMDMKKMVALSTLSQLGVMMTAMGAGFSILGFLHMLAHAFFKALLFVSAGNLIHSSEGYQDMRVMGGNTEVMPFTKSVMVGASLSLCGLPFMSAFYSKELVIEGLLVYHFSFYVYTILMLGILMTVFYSMRFLVVSMSWVSRQRALFFKSDTDYFTNFSMIILLTPAVVGGGVISEMVKINNLFMVHVSLKFSNILLIILGSMLFFWFFKTEMKIFKYGLWSLSSLWALPFFSSRVPLALSMNSGDFFYKLSDFSWVYFIFTNFCTSSVFKKSSSLLVFEKAQFMRVLTSLVVWALVVVVVVF